MRHLEDRVIVVTGAGRGIGLAYARWFAGAGAKVVVNDAGVTVLGADAEVSVAAQAVERIVGEGGIAVADSHDVVTQAEGIIQTALDAFGRIDGLVNNAGILILGQLDEMPGDDVRRMLEVHVTGTLGTITAAWPLMRSQGHGRIVNTASAAAFGVGGGAVYATAKSAIIGLTRATACDGAAHDIKVNAIMPMGYSRMTEGQAGLADFMRSAFPSEAIAPFAASLLVPQTPCTGETFAVGGGRAARVFLGTVPGLVGFTSIDECLAGFETIMSREGYVAPNSLDEEIGYEYQCLGIDLADVGLDFSSLDAAP